MLSNPLNNLRVLLQLLLAGLITLTLPAAAQPDMPTATPEIVGVSTSRLQRLPDAMQRYIDANQLAGTVTLIARNGRIIHQQSQGWKNKEAGEGMTDDSIFVIMSMTKPIVSTALMMLYEEGHFLLTDPITKWIREVAGKEELVTDRCGTHREAAVRPITVRPVFSHTSARAPNSDPLPPEEATHHPRQPTLAANLRTRAATHFAVTPGWML